MLDFIREQSQLILTGIFITFVSTLMFRITPTGFVSGGKYRTKQGAIFIYLLSIGFLGLLTPLLYAMSGIIISYLSFISIIGILIFCTNFIINQSVPSWKHTSPKTLLIYSFALLLIFSGFYIKLPEI